MDTGWPRGRARHGGVDEVPVPAPGRLWLAGRRYVAPDPEQALVAVGASVLVCLCEAEELAGHWPDYAAWLRRSDAAWWRPVPDLHAPEPPAARELVAGITARLDGGTGVLVHCGAGFGRAGTVAVAVLLAYGTPLEVALETVARARPGAGPEVGAQADLLGTLAHDGEPTPPSLKIR